MCKKPFVFLTIALSLLFFISCEHEKYHAYIDNYDPDNIEITFEVPAKAKENYTSLTENTQDDWLLLFYLDGDNYQNDDLFRQMAQISKGFSKILKKDGKTVKSDFANVKAVGLWDGFNTDSNFTPKHFLPNSYLFEFKYPEQSFTDEIVVDYKNFTIDITSDVMKSQNNWLTEIQEVNMGDKSTLSNFIQWAENKYNPEGTLRTVLIITGTGGGAFGTEIDSYIPLDSRTIPQNSRAAARDYSSNSEYLTAGEISEALEENGFAGSNKLELLIIDSAFSCSIEDCFEYKDNILSLIASPSDVPGGSVDFNYLLQAFKKSSSIYDVGTRLVTVYANRNYKPQISETGTQLSEKGMASLSFVDLSHIQLLGDNICLISNEILKRKNNEQYAEEVDRLYSMYDCMTNDAYGFLNYDDFSDNFITESAMFYKSNYHHKIPKYDYFWGYIYQYDLGYMISLITTISEKNGINTIYHHGNNIITELDKIIISSWRNGTTEKEGLYPVISNSSIFGLTINGPARVQSKEYLQPYNFSDFKFKNYRYDNDVNIKNWRDLLYSLYPEQFQDTNFYVYVKN